MNDESLHLHQLALRKRRQYLDLVYSEEGRAPKRAGLVGLGRAVYLLATRHIAPPEWPGHDVDEETKLVWEIAWYSHYLEALVELTPRLQAAIRDGKITPRGIRTRAPMPLDEMSQWLQLDAKTAIAASAKIFWAGDVPETPYLPWGGWADASAGPGSVFVTESDFVAWVAAEGIATPDEANALLADAQHSNSGAPEKAALPVPAFRPKVGWQIALFDSWLQICKTYSRIPTAPEAANWLKKNDESGTILNKAAGSGLWWKPQRGAAKEVPIKTIENVISAWKVSGVLPT